MMEVMKRNRKFSDEKGNLYYINNIKAFLIITVVIGHMVSCVKSIDPIAADIYSFFYSFHMPAFIFITGYLSASSMKSGKKMLAKLATFVLLYIVYQICFDLFQRYVTHSVSAPFSLFRPRIGLWYLLVLIMWIPLCYVLRNRNKKMVILTAIILGVLVGLFDNIGKDYALARAVVFFPFFLFGIYFPRDVFLGIAKPIEGHWKKLIGCLVVLCGVLVAVSIPNTMVNELYQGQDSYSLQGFGEIQGMIYRGIWYLGSTILAAAFIYLVPRQQIRITYLGERTLQIFLLHSIICRTFYVEKTLQPLHEVTGVFGVIVASILLMFLLGIKYLDMFVVWPNKIVDKFSGK